MNTIAEDKKRPGIQRSAVNLFFPVIPAKAGIQGLLRKPLIRVLDSGLRRNDGKKDTFLLSSVIRF